MVKTLKCKKYNNKTRKRKDKSIIKKLNAQANKYINNSLVNKLVSEFRSRTKPQNELPKTNFNKYSYSLEKRKADNYGRIYYYDNNKKHVLVDWDKLSKNHDFFLVGDYAISYNEKYISYCVDYKGDRLFNLYIKDIESGKTNKIATNCFDNSVFSGDSRAIYYIKYDMTDLRPCKVYKYDICTKKHKLIFYEKNRGKMIAFNESSDKQNILLDVRTYATSTPHLIDDEKVTPLFSDKKHQRIFVDHWRGKWYVLKKNHNKTAIYTTNDFKNLNVLMPNKKECIYEKFFLKGDYLIIVSRENQKRKLILYNINNKKIKTLTLCNIKYSVYIQYISNLNINDNTISLKYTTFIHPTKLINIDMNTLKIENVYDFKNKGYNPNNYIERIYQINKHVSITMLYKKGNSLKNKKCLLYGYGSYGHTINPSFDPAVISLLDRDFIYCFAHIRGSSFNGYSTWLEGKLLNKKNTFKDFIDAGEWLIKKKYTSSEKLTIWGRSAGGLLIGSVINMKPELAHFAILGVPFVDVIDTMTDSCQPLVTEEYEEWGNPNNKAVYDYMSSYDPIKNIDLSAKYPNIYIYSNIEDTLVLYDQVLKYYLKIKDSSVFSVQDKFALLKINLKYGHTQSTKKTEGFKETAEIYSMIIKY